MNHQYPLSRFGIRYDTLRSVEVALETVAGPCGAEIDVGRCGVDVSPFSKDRSTEGEWQTRSGRTNLCQ